MVCTEASTGGDTSSCKDYGHSPIPEPELPERDKSLGKGLPSIKYDLELVRKPDGSLEWQE